LNPGPHRVWDDLELLRDLPDRQELVALGLAWRRGPARGLSDLLSQVAKLVADVAQEVNQRRRLSADLSYQFPVVSCRLKRHVHGQPDAFFCEF
jgi:hypothetical protein